MAKTSAGLLLYRPSPDSPTTFEVLLVHPGGPLWAKKDVGVWSIPKGEHGPADDPALCAAREFEEELGVAPPPGPWTDLGEVTQSGGKRVRAWAVLGDLDVDEVKSNTFEMEWPPRSGEHREFPEVDRAQWSSVEDARHKLNPAQVVFVDRLEEALEHLA